MARESQRKRRERAAEIAKRLESEYRGTAAELCALDHEGPFRLLVATILSAQCTDERVNMVTPEVFRRWPNPGDLALASPQELEDVIRSTGFFRSKAQHLIAMSEAIMARFDGRFPSQLADLVSLPGVGRKTANVVRSVALGLPGLPVDTHVTRLSRRLGLTKEKDAVKIEADLCALLPEDEWGSFSLRLILHGRRVCLARRPRCSECHLSDLCPSVGLEALATTASKRTKTAKRAAPAMRRPQAQPKVG